MNPKVTVIIPIYQAEQYLERCIRSLMEQTLGEMEYIFINDCTPDKSMDVLKDVLSDYPQRKGSIRLVENSENRGTAYVRTQGLKLANGDYVGWCDADDWCELDMFEKMWTVAVRDNCDIVICNYCVDADNSSQKVRRKRINNPHAYIYQLYKEPYCLSEALWDKLVKRSLIVENQVFPFEGIDRGEDFNMYIRTFYYAKKCEVLNDCLYHYWNNPISMTKKKEDWTKQKENFDLVVAFLEQQDKVGLKKTCDFIKFTVKMQFKHLFMSEVEWFQVYRECHSSIIYFESIPLVNRIVLQIVYSSYFFFRLYKKIHG